MMRTITNSSPPLCIGPRCILSTRTRCCSLSPCNNYPFREFLYTRIYSPSTENSPLSLSLYFARSLARTHNFLLPSTCAEIFMHFIKPLSEVIRLVSDIVHIDTMQIRLRIYPDRWSRRSRDRVLVLPCIRRRENGRKKKKKEKKKGKKGKEPVEGGNFA